MTEHEQVCEAIGLPVDTPWPQVLATLRRRHQMLSSLLERREQESGTPLTCEQLLAEFAAMAPQ